MSEASELELNLGENIANLRATIDRLTKERDEARANSHSFWKLRAELAEKQRDEARAAHECCWHDGHPHGRLGPCAATDTPGGSGT